MGTGGLQAKEHIVQGVSGAITSNDNSQVKSSLKRAEPIYFLFGLFPGSFFVHLILCNPIDIGTLPIEKQ